ncbi:fungal peroxidase [Desarmillaria tabescens]|uniref:Fungal peroxidase n=1 Tax=Armillaria tabescens TaxID=1929756 RepID=A0AA39MYW3_ARMTA|nr:fungal peroxidase [Desarmillaria tabescens]KAK0451293.1 fungal peroxidase [Desarmillaria tabescens]
MKASGAIFTSLLVLSLAFNAAGHSNNPGQLRRRQVMRTASILNDPAPQPNLPTTQEAQSAAASVGLNLTDVQADILVGMKKKKELFFFFGIQNTTDFKNKLATDIHPLITSTTQILDVTTQPLTAVNLAFSQSGLSTLGITDDLGDQFYSQGQEADSAAIGDPGTGNWVQSFAGTSVHGVFLLASDTLDNVNDTLSDLLSTLGDSIAELHRVQGEARPGSEEGHEHFGFMDGISQPAVIGFTQSPLPGQLAVDAGEILLAEDGDSTTRPSWAKDGSFLVFRQMEQLVPEFNKFLLDNPISEPGVLTPEEGSALLGARMIGRWKSGAPVYLAPLFDDPTLASDPMHNNNFTYHDDDADFNNQTRCPFAAHTRKTRPRGDFTPEETAHHIIRAGIPYGPEVTDDEATSNTTSASLERGLAFVAYQSNIGNGFRFLQQLWVNNANFLLPSTGVDPIIGSAGTDPSSRSRPITGLDPTDPSRAITLQNDFVVSRGGEYFFSPSISAILNTIAA